MRIGAATLVIVVDALGALYVSYALSAATTTGLPLDGLSTGMYSVQAQANADIVAKRLVAN